MSWLKDGTVWLAAVFLVFAGAWFRNLLSAVFPGPQRTILALKNLVTSKSPSQNRVRFVLAWLANDPNGNNVSAVAATFTEIEGIQFCRSARIVFASGAADAWRPAMRRKAKRLLSAWHADIAVVGRVDRDGDALTLWFVSAAEGDTLADTSNNTYALNLNRLPTSFVDHLHVQIRALVLTLAIPKTSNNARHIGLRQLAATVPKLENLFRTLSTPVDRSSLCMSYVLAQSSLGEWLGESDRLRSAIDRAREILDAAHNDPDADTLLTIRVNLARTLHLLGEREADTKLLEEAVSLLNDALGEGQDPDREPFDAGIRGLAANALRALVHLQPNPEHLDLAAGLLESALEVHRREEDAPLVAITQNNLGLVYLDLARATHRRDAVEHALSLFDAASPVAKQSAMPTLWAMTQNNAGQAHELLAQLDPDSAVAELELSRDRYQQAVHGYSDSTTPYHSASAKTNLARVLMTLGASTGSGQCLDRAIALLRDTHDAGAKNPNTTGTGATLAGLGTALLTRGKLRSSPRDLADAVPWLERALRAYPLQADPLNWVKIKTNLANCHFGLAQTRKDVERIRTGFSVLQEIFLHRELAAVFVSFPELYLAFLQGTDLITSLEPDPGYVGDWIAAWTPLFTDREHRGVPSFVLVTVQNNIAVVCQDHGALPDAIRLCRHALARLDADDAATRDAPEHSRTSPPPPSDAAEINADQRVTTKRNLATALRMSGEKTACAPHLREAIDLFEEVLAAQDASVDPMDWVITQSGRARAYKELYLVEGDTDVLRISLSAYDQTIAALPKGKDSPWHQQVPRKREVVKNMLKQATGPRDTGP
ncbi:MAG: tetratricopeptide repeat protein [Chloroflexota bacterium]|nr:tetratricopeptide repeat protein [Chloroflexota bacterium]